MKKVCLLIILIALLAIPTAVFAAEIPNAPPSGQYVLDTLDWLTPTQEQDINALVSELDTHELAQIAVVTLNDCGPDSQQYRNDEG